MTEQLALGERIRLGAIEAAKIACAATFSAIMVAPQAAEHALETTTVDTQIAEFPAELSFYPQTTKLSVLNQGSIYVDRTKSDIGMQAEVTGLPRLDSSGKIGDYLGAKRLDIYASMADSPGEVAKVYQDELVSAAWDSALRYELIGTGLGTVLLYGGGIALGWRRRLGGSHKIPELGKTGTTGLAIMAVAGSFCIASSHHEDWLASEPQPANLTRITALDGTSIAGASTDNPELLVGIGKGIQYAKLLKVRRTEQRDAYMQQAGPELVRQLETLPDLRDHEELLFVMTDMHSSQAGIDLAKMSIKTLQDRYGKEALQTVLNVGDTSYGADFQRQSVVDQAFASLPVTVLLARGNHDVGKVPTWAREAGMVDLKGYTTTNGLGIYGKPDVELTPFLGASYFPNPLMTEQALGEQAATGLSEHTVDVLALHEPTALGAALGIDSMTHYLADGEDESLTTCDYGAGSLSHIQVSLANAGHWHDQYPLKMVCNEDGTWGVINVQGTGGGANEAPTINDWSDPDGKPLKTVSFRVFIRNTQYHSITGAIDIQIKPDGSILPIVRTDIGTPDGAPFSKNTLLDASAKQKAG